MTARRWLPLLLVLVAVGAAGCGGDDDEGAATTAETQAESVTAGLVSDVGRFNDKSFNQSALEGLNRAKDELGADTRAIESRAAGDYVPNLSSLARQHYGVTIGVGFLLAEAVNSVARKFPDENFAIIDYSVMAPPFTDAAKNVATPKNVQGLTFATNENSYLIGCMAAMMAKKQGGKQVISAVGGLKLPTVSIFIAGYQDGAKACNPGIQVLVGYSQDFVAQDKCKEIALNQIAQGSQVVFQVAGGCGLGALDAAKEKGGGSASTRTSPTSARTSSRAPVKRVDTSVFDTVKAVQEGTFKGGTDALFNLENDGVAVGTTSDKVTQDILDKVDELKQQIIDGQPKPKSTLEPFEATGTDLSIRPRRSCLESPQVGVGDPRPRDARHHQALPGHRRERRCRLRPASRRGPRPPRRERRREVDADEHPLRPLHAGRGRDHREGEAGDGWRRRATRSRTGSGWSTSTSC